MSVVAASINTVCIN